MRSEKAKAGTFLGDLRFSRRYDVVLGFDAV
jgi:hypothetical protein